MHRCRQGQGVAGAGDGVLAFTVHHGPDDPVPVTGDLLTGMWELLGSLGAVPRRLIWDNETGIGRRNSYAAGVAAFAGVLATRIVQVKPYDPESKGVVERANQFLETSFLPGRVFTSLEDFNNHLAHWLPKANARLVRRTGARPADLLARDKAGWQEVVPLARTANERALQRHSSHMTTARTKLSGPMPAQLLE
jgi:hypothetical protein